MFFNLLVISGLVDNGGVSVDQVLLELVRKDTFDWSALVGFSDLTDNFSNLSSSH